MVPTPQEPPAPRSLPRDGEDVVISGVSGIYPTCNNVKEFREKLFSKTNMVDCDYSRWKYTHPELTQHCGNVPGLDKFDAQFFMVHYRLANSTDAMSRKLLEHTYQAIFDSGLSPKELSGTNLGVFIGTCLTETEKVSAYSHIGVGIVGCNRAMFSNRISYWLNAKGPSMTIDASCSGSMVALANAYQCIRRGDCEAAIVGAANIHLHPQSCIHYGRMFNVNSDGKTKSFDKNSDGQSPGECISILFLQKAKDAKRIYAQVCNAKTGFSQLSPSHFDRFGPDRDPAALSEFIRDFYNETEVSPKDIEYVEAYGSSFPEADRAELAAIAEVFCRERRRPLLVGSVMSNVGYSQASTTIAAISKMCVAYQAGKIPANLHYRTPHDVPHLQDGRMRVITDHEDFRRSYVGVNNLSLTGINGHVLLRGRYKAKDPSKYTSKIPHLVTLSGRQESSVQLIMDDLKSSPLDPEEIALLHGIHKTRVSKHLARGFTILDTNESGETVSLREKVDYYDDARRPLWFVYSGMGSQWVSMGTHLMKIPTFAAAIQRCHEVLKPKGLDLIHILTSPDRSTYDTILHSFVGIAAVQIGLTDILLQMGLEPDFIIGHSVGELGCAYADGCLTAEQMILSAYYRGRVSLETSLIHGSMAAVGLGYKRVAPLCPPEIDVACHNAPESSTVSGPADFMKVFVAGLVARGIFAKEVPTSNIAYHSRYIKDAGPGLLKYLKKVIENPRERSRRWLSTSVAEAKWNEPHAKYCSAEYLTNNLLSSVLFEETVVHVPDNAVLIEVAPHGLMQAILKRFLPSNCINIPLTRRGHADNALFLLEAIGELYMSGYNPDLSVLYPKVEFPVSTETRNLSHLVEWVHTEKWTLPVYVTADRMHAAACDMSLSTRDDEHSYLTGHVINGEMLYPYTGALVCVWDTLAMTLEAPLRQLSVRFHDVHFHTPPTLSDHRILRLSVELQRGSGRFEVTNECVPLASGYIEASPSDTISLLRRHPDRDVNDLKLNCDQIYRIFHETGYEYKDEFRVIEKANSTLSHAIIPWKCNWVTLLEGLIQMNAFHNHNGVLVHPRYIHDLHIDVGEHDFIIRRSEGMLDADIFHDKSATRCGGVLMENITFTPKMIEHKQRTVLKTLKFAPHLQSDYVDVKEALETFIQIIAENVGKDEISVLNIDQAYSLLNVKLKEVLSESPSVKVHLNTITKDEFLVTEKLNAVDFSLLDIHTGDRKINDKLRHLIENDTFAIVLDDNGVDSSKYRVASSTNTPDGKLLLVRWQPSPLTTPTAVMTVDSEKELPLIDLALKNQQSDKKIVVVTHAPVIDEIKDYIKKINNDTAKRVIMAATNKKESLNIESKLSNFDLTYNYLQDGKWGGKYLSQCDGRSSNKIQGKTLRSSQIGDLESLQWVELPDAKSNLHTVSVHYAGLNFHDAKAATGEILVSHSDNDLRFGMDFSGVNSRSERVMGLLRGGAVSSHVTADPALLWPVPDHWSLEDAATVPLPYMHAFYCLAIKCRMAPKMRVLVHGAAGALGQAAVSIALGTGCTVFATVSDVRKKRFLRRLFPDLPEEHIGNSRDVTFADMVLGATKGEGCDIIISCVKGYLKNVTLQCCAASGYTLDTQQIHSKDDFAYGMYNMTRARSYTSVDFSAIFDSNNFKELERLQLMMTEGIARGYVRPLSRVTYEAKDVVRAFRLLAGSRHRGRALVKIYEEASSVAPRLSVSDSGSHVIVSDNIEDSLTTGLMDLLVDRGARKGVIHYLNTEPNGHDVYLRKKIKNWQDREAEVKLSFGPLTDTEKAKAVVFAATDVSPVEGVYVMLTNRAAKTNTDDALLTVSNLDNLSRNLCPSLRHFGVINKKNDKKESKISRLCVKRREDGLPATSLQILHSNSAKAEDQDDFVHLKATLSAIEGALCSVHTELWSSTKPVKDTTLLEEISRIIGVPITDTMADSLTLPQLGLEPDRLAQLFEVYQRFQVVALRNKLLLLTLGELRAFQRKYDESKTKTVTGLNALFSYVDSNELLATADIVFVPTAAQKSTMRDDEFDSGATYMAMVPGLEGHHVRFNLLCERLKLPVAVLQPALDHYRETVPETAERLLKVMLRKLKPKAEFYLLGYSFGVMVTLEMAAILEDLGYEGVIYCVDGSPDTFREMLETLLREAGASNETRLQNALARHMFHIITGEPPETIDQELDSAETWQDKVKVYVGALRSRVTLCSQYVRALIEAAYARIEQARLYNPERLRLKPLRSQIVLMRSISQPPSAPADLGLSKYSMKTPIVYELSADHAGALDDLRCANVVNKHLSPAILEAYSKKNLCNTYLRNACTYTQFSADYD